MDQSNILLDTKKTRKKRRTKAEMEVSKKNTSNEQPILAIADKSKTRKKRRTKAEMEVSKKNTFNKIRIDNEVSQDNKSIQEDQEEITSKRIEGEQDESIEGEQDESIEGEQDESIEGDNSNFIKKKINTILNSRELKEREQFKKDDNEYDFLYPSLNDSNFNTKIAERKEFHDLQYDGEIHSDVKKQSDIMCNSDFELAPHQQFVRNFLSFQTPYNSLLLYHGLGSGKTCSAISVSEEMRDYIIQMGIVNQIFIVASPNVQTNFRLQLFDESKLKLIDGLWNIRACTGNKFLKEINPMNMKGLTKENIIKQVNRVIDTYYRFFGYIEFANYIYKKSNIEDKTITNEKQKNIIIKNKLQSVFNGKLIIIDEIHNIRMSNDKKSKRVVNELMKLVKNVHTLRLLFLSATPMFNSYKEIIWLLNLMNLNDRRSTIEFKEVFNNDGSFVKSSSGENIGKELLERKATGYVSFVRGENPYTFPYRIWPAEFSPENTFLEKPYPTLQFNGISPVVEKIKHLSLYLVNIGEYQQRGYDYIIQRLKGGHIGKYNNKMISTENIESFGYTLLQQPLEALNIIYPDERLEIDDTPTFNSHDLIGGEGLKRIMTYEESNITYFRSNFDYKQDTIEKYGRIFSTNEIGKYSQKIKTICDKILQSSGVILVYSQYIDAGLIPVALALEEIGFSRAGNGKNLFGKNPPMKKHGLTYSLITGDKGFTPNAEKEIKMATNDSNVNGKNIKVILISQTGAEGLDLKFIRQVHILEPWYNMSRIEQIIGRAVRTCSHKALPFSYRNVEIYLYASLMNESQEETADIYLYNKSEIKAIQIGEITRLLKETSIDCILNYGQTNFTEETMTANNVKPVTLELSCGKKIENYKIGDKPYSFICDYMESCSYTCRPNKNISDENVVNDSYNENFIIMNTERLIYKFKQMMKDKKEGQFFYRKKDIQNAFLNYTDFQINAALQQMVEDKNEYITDKYGRMGNLINIHDLYLFQPLEINNSKATIFERTRPLNFKRDKINIKLSKDTAIDETIIKEKKSDNKKKSKINENAIEENAIEENAIEENAIEENDIEENDIIRDFIDIEQLFTHLMHKYNLSQTYHKITRDEKNWYKICYFAFKFMTPYGFTENDLFILMVQHMVDELSYNDIILLLNFYNNEKTNETSIDINTYLYKFIKSYVLSKILIGKNNIQGILWRDINKQIIIVKNNTEWSIAEAEDIKDLDLKIKEYKANILSHLNDDIGFMNTFRKETYVVFKTKNILKSGNIGARCDQNSDSNKSLLELNNIIGEENRYKFPPKMSKEEKKEMEKREKREKKEEKKKQTQREKKEKKELKETNMQTKKTKKLEKELEEKREKREKEEKELTQKKICVLQELYLRSFNKEMKNGKYWFLSPPDSILTNIEKYSSSNK